MTYEEKYNEILEWARKNKARLNGVPIEEVLPELAESEDERMIRKIESFLSAYGADYFSNDEWREIEVWLEKKKENHKSDNSIPSNCVSDAKCEDRWHKVTDSLPDNGRLVLAKDCLGNVLLARYDGENWEVNVYDNEDHYCHNSISKWCEIPSEKQKESLHIPETSKENANSFTDEDERIRQDIFKFIDEQYPEAWKAKKSKMLDWLEKQKDRKPGIRVKIPKFRVGDIIQRIPLEKWDSSKKIVSIDECGYNYDLSHLGDTISGGAIGFAFEDEYELVEQKPAESISQLTVQGKGVYKICPRCKERMVRDDSMVYTSMPPQYRYECPKCGESECDTVMYDNPEMEEQKPADLSEMMVHKEPYIAPVPTPTVADEQKPAEWNDFEIRLMDCMLAAQQYRQGSIDLDIVKPWAEELSELIEQPKKKWDEFDKDCLKRAIWYVENPAPSVVKDTNLVLWLQSLHERFNLQPRQEWSEEDKMAIDRACVALRAYANGDLPEFLPSELIGYADRLQSLRPSWKPTEKDLMMLEHIIGQYEIGNKNSKTMGYLPRVEELNFLKKILDVWKN